MRGFYMNLLILFILTCFLSFARAGHEKRQVNDRKQGIEALRSEIVQSQQNNLSVQREKAPERLAEINLIKDNIVNSSGVPFQLSTNLTNWLKEGTTSNTGNGKLGMMLEDVIKEPNLNMIDENVEKIVNPNLSKDNTFQPDVEEIKVLATSRYTESNINNLYRENLQIKVIREMTSFKIGMNVEQWKTIVLEKGIALIGISKENVMLVISTENSYEVIKEIKIDQRSKSVCIETLNVWDSSLNTVRNIILMAIDGDLIWNEITADNEIKEIFKWRLMKFIDKIIYFQHDGSDFLMLSTLDESERSEIEFIEFNFQNEEFWVVQAFKLPNLPKSMVYLDAGKDLIVAFTQNSYVSIYRHQNTKFEKGKFTFFKNIDAANVSTINGFRIGGHSYLAIGGDQPQILRYINGDFHPQTILSQTFGHVEEFLAIPIKIYRDDLVLLVQHTIKFRTHNLTAVDALIWNGIAFESALSVPCMIAAEPTANGFTCMLDYEREEGLLGASFVVTEKNNSFYIIIPRHEAHSGIFKVEYEIVEAEDPLMKEIENVKKAIQLINGMMDLEMTVKQQVDEALKMSLNPKEIFNFGEISLEEVNAEVIHFDGNVTLESDQIEFLDMFYSREDFIADLDEIERTLVEDERKVKEIDAHLNRVIRKHRQTPNIQQTNVMQETPIHHIGTHTFNGQLDIKTLRVLPDDPPRRSKRHIDPIEESILGELKVDDITAKFINGIPVDDILFLDDNGDLNVPNQNIVFQNSLHAQNIIMKNDGKVNGIDFSREVLAVDSPNFPDSLTFDKIYTDNLFVNKLNGIDVGAEALRNITANFDDENPTITTREAWMHKNMNIETINGMNWNEILQKMVMVNSPATISNLTVNGNVVLFEYLSAVNVNSVNGLSFPDDFVLKVGPTETIITGTKTFSGKLYTKAVDTDGTINGIDPSNIITLDQPQHINGNITFSSVEVMKKLEVHGTVSSKKLEEFLPNPTMEDSKEILAECTFRELIVEGNVKVQKSLNGQNINGILSEVVYETIDGSEITITGPKSFMNLNIDQNAEISSNYIDNVVIDSIMTTKDDQVVTIEQLSGDIYFSNLKMSGLFDGINTTDLEMNSIRTFGDQFIQTPLIIANHLSANTIDIKHSINDVLDTDFYYINQPVDLLPTIKVGMMDLSANNMNVNDDIVGTGSLKNIDIKELEQHRFSKSLEQNIIFPTKVEKLVIDEMFGSKVINAMDFSVFKEYLMDLKNFKSNLLSGKHKLDNLIIDGNVHLRFINDKDFEVIKNQAIWLNRPNNVNKMLHFLDEIEIYDGLKVDNLVNGKNLVKFMENWISRSENSVILNSDKNVHKSVMVEENLEVGEINGIPYEDIFRRKDLVEVQHLNILGTVNVNKLIVKDVFNREKASTLENIYLFDSDTNTHTINLDIKLSPQVVINNLNTPYLNKLNVSFWLSDLIKFDDASIDVSGKKVFKRSIKSENGTLVDFLNDINVKNLLENIIVMKNYEIVNVNSNIHFIDDFYAELVALKGNLSADFINGLNLHEWIHNGLPTHKDLYYEDTIYADSRLVDAENLIVKRINGIPFNTVFTLHTNQTFDHNILVEGDIEVKKPLILNGYVNQIDLKSERDNTVMITDAKQEIFTNIMMSDATVTTTVHANGLINGKDITKITILNSSPTFESSLTFNSLEVPSLISNDRLSGINFTKWYDSALWKHSKDVQYIYGTWRIKSAYLQDNVYGNGLINGQPVNEIEKNLNKNVHEIEMALTNYSVEYRSMCEKLQYRADNYAKSSIYVLKYFEEAFKIVEYSDIFSYFILEDKSKQHYLFTNTNCSTNIYKWNRNDERFIKTSTIVTGVVYSWNKLEPEKSNDIFIITNSKMAPNAPCIYGGTNSWKLIDDKLIHIASISEEPNILEIFVHPSNSKSFYALEVTDYVINYDVFANKLEQWKLPHDNPTYSFVAADILAGLNINNGRRIFSLDSKFLRGRKQRSVIASAPNLDVPINKHQDETRAFTIKQPSFDIPTIPSKPIKTTKKIDFLSKVKDAGDVIRRSFNVQSAYMSNGTKLREIGDSENKLIFAIKSPNITALRNKIIRNGIKLDTTGNDAADTDDKFNEQQEASEIIDKNSTISKTTESFTEVPLETTTKLIEPKFQFTPRVFIDGLEKNEKSVDVNDNLLEQEPTALPVTEISGKGIRDAENLIIPEHGHGEIIALNVGTEKNKKTLYVITRKRNSVIQGNNVIEIYSDIINGLVFQYIVCADPSNIHALRFRDETLLAFLESQREVKVYIYRGIQGFTLFKSISLPEYTNEMSSITLPAKYDYKCDHRYLVFHIEKELLFMAVKVDGNCGLKHIECDGF